MNDIEIQRQDENCDCCIHCKPFVKTSANLRSFHLLQIYNRSQICDLSKKRVNQWHKKTELSAVQWPCMERCSFRNTNERT